MFQPCDDSAVKTQHLTLLIWVVKALVLCNHRETDGLLDKLLHCMSDEDVGQMASAGFDLILRESEVG